MTMRRIIPLLAACCLLATAACGGIDLGDNPGPAVPSRQVRLPPFPRTLKMAPPSSPAGVGTAQTAAGIVTHDLYARRKPLPRPKLLLYTLVFAVIAGLFIRHEFPPMSLNTISATALLTAIFYVIVKIRLGKIYYADVIKDGRAALLRCLGAHPLQLDLDAIPSPTRRGPVVTGAAYDGNRLYIIEDGVCAQIPFAMVRSWRWRIEAFKDPEVHVNVTVNGGYAAPVLPQIGNSMAARGVALAKLASGLTVQVADVGKPTWRFTTDNRATLERWHEILTQMREGSLAVN